jgi:cell division protein FtsZ
MIEFDENKSLGAKVKIIGIGGGGNNAINTMISSQLSGVEFIAANTDAQALAANLAPIKLQLGASLTKGLGRELIPRSARRPRRCG